MKNLSSKKIFFKDNKRYILFKYFRNKNYFINETDKEIQKFKNLSEARAYLREQGLILTK